MYALHFSQYLIISKSSQKYTIIPQYYTQKKVVL